ncbi:hypothetical protein PVAP13_4NG203664 [Panicum virgatum]|uniref:Uncharacterized protein n=1 Tax=Panicum virgatum TaxID=38727 RepID=A0A8T0T1W8_PANVG|nr:hypothetical protein PVAP13_4NG203664 [Panicum virgatum]KAG2605712.1 hypothetical protein PVAP13_4NG203664 [Panicum virgatum]
MSPKKAASKSKEAQADPLESAEQKAWRPNPSGGEGDGTEQVPPVQEDALPLSPTPTASAAETHKRKATATEEDNSPRPEKRVREASPPPAASPIPARPPSPVSTSCAAAQQVDMLAKPKAKASGAAGAIVPLKVLRPKKLPIKKSTSKAVDLGLGGIKATVSIPAPGPKTSEALSRATSSRPATSTEVAFEAESAKQKEVEVAAPDSAASGEDKTMSLILHDASVLPLSEQVIPER